jgi:hypothetical protein
MQSNLSSLKTLGTCDSKERLIVTVSGYFFSREKSRAMVIVISLVLGLPNKPNSPHEPASPDIRESTVAPRAKLRNKVGQRFLIR